ncbi:DUF6259 domain-containing protein [Larkinella arboricola]
MKAILLILLLGVAWTSSFAADERGIELNSQHLELTFSAKDGGLLKMVKSGSTILSNASATALWEINLLNRQEEKFKLRSLDLKQVAVKRIGNDQLELTWSGSDLAKLSEISVQATVRLAAGDSLSYWGFQVTNLGEYAVENVIYPIIGGIETSARTQMAVPSWMGHLYENPAGILKRQRDPYFRWVYPGLLSMQFISIYQPEKNGLYLASDDAKAHQKNFQVGLGDPERLVSGIVNYPEFKFGLGSYAIPYQAVVGGFKGDWFNAAEIYRNWGTKQEWATRARLKNDLVPAWLKNTGLWIWNRGRTTEVLDPALAIREKTQSPVSILWHWWHGSSYDDSFPEYIPPRDGKTRFMVDLRKAQAKNINAIVYMNQMQWSRSTQSWETEGAITHAAKNRDGSTTDQVFNIFSGKSLTNMCLGAEAWRNKYTALADTVLNVYGVNGIYMDQACLSRMCFDPHHGHPLGGGNYWAQGSGKLTLQIRDRIKAAGKNKTTLSGEGVSEAWLPYLDAFLALQVSMERYSGTGATVPIPLFQAVYHPYGVVYGNYSSLLKPPYDEKWPAAQKPADALTLLDEKYNQQFLMEQSRSFVWGMQPMLSNYLPSLDVTRKKEMEFLYELVKVRNQATEYLLHGQMMRNIALSPVAQEMAISKLSIYAGQKDKVTHYQKAYPTVYSGVWLSARKTLGIALSNIGAAPYRADLHIDLTEYGLKGKSGKVYLITKAGKKQSARFSNGKIDHRLTIPATSSLLLEIEPLE